MFSWKKTTLYVPYYFISLIYKVSNYHDLDLFFLLRNLTTIENDIFKQLNQPLTTPYYFERQTTIVPFEV